MADARLKTPTFWLPLPSPKTQRALAQVRSGSEPTHLVDFRRLATAPLSSSWRLSLGA